MKNWWQNWEVSHLASKAVGIFSSVIASHVAIIMASPEYSRFWASWYLTAPTIINKAGFEEKMTATLGTLWLIIDHFMWKFQENQQVTGSPTIQVEKAAPPLSPANPQPNAQRAEDPQKGA